MGDSSGREHDVELTHSRTDAPTETGAGDAQHHCSRFSKGL